MAQVLEDKRGQGKLDLPTLERDDKERKDNSFTKDRECFLCVEENNAKETIENETKRKLKLVFPTCIKEPKHHKGMKKTEKNEEKNYNERWEKK